MSERYLHVGDTLTWTDATGEERTETVQQPCEHDSGRWYCATHRQMFPNNMSATGHTHGARAHVMVWICSEHGPEAFGDPQP